MTTHVAMVAGFMFSASFGRVALIRKNKPDWQTGKLNGIGGKVDPVDAGDPLLAMCREFKEETGYYTRTTEWHHFCHMSDGKEWSVEFFACVGNVDELRTMEAEPIEVTPVDSIRPHRPDIVDNLPWLVSLAINHLQTGRPSFVTVEYP